MSTKHSDGLPEKQIRSSELMSELLNINRYTIYENTKT